MDSETARRLAAINRRFYEERGAEFSRTRGAAWPGWQRLLPALRAQAARARDAGRRLCVLDLGCGNGRFARFLAAELAPAAGAPAAAPAPLAYLGIDASRALTRDARGALRGLAQGALVRADFALGAAALAGLRGRFDAACCFGALHHVPGRAQRRALLASLADALRPGGLLAFSAWQLHRDRRFPGRRLAFEEWNRSAREPIDLAQLEPGDALLAFGAASGLPRYCHFCDDGGIRALLEGLPLELLEAWLADGRGDALNRYYLLRRLPMQGK